MALDTITAVTDDVTDNLASYANEKRTALNKLMPSTPYAGYGAASSMTGNVTLTDADLPLLSYSPTAARDLTLPAVATTNHPFYVVNRSGTYAITVKDASAVTITTISAGQSVLLLSDGANGWYAVGGGTYGNLFPHEGVMLNGKISVTVATNNITVALKTLAGNNPSASDPVYVRIADTVRSVTAALSVTKNAGTQWFGLGTPFAALEQNFFVYLIWNTTPATDIVDIGFARVPSFTLYSEASGTTTNEKYLAFGNASTPTSTDNMVNVGRFAATLSATASFNWSVPTFTTSNLIQRPIYETDWMNWLPAPTGYSAVPTNTVYRYRIVGKMVEAEVREAAAGTSNATTLTMTAPFTATTLTNMSWTGLGRGSNNSANLATTVIGNIASAAATINFFIDAAAAAWTGSGTKSVTQWRIWYQVA